MVSVFLRKQGKSPKNRVLDFFIIHSDFDYSLKEIADYSGAGYSTVKILVKKLEKDGWLVPTRKISKIKLYKLNVNNPEVSKFIDFYWEVMDNSMKPRVKHDYRSYSSSPIAASARNV